MRPTRSRAPGDEATLPKGAIRIQRWELANHVVYAHGEGQQLFLARHPLAVLHAVCDPGPPLAAKKGVDVEVSFAAPHLGREVQTLVSALGLGSELSLALGVDGDRLVPRGVNGALVCFMGSNATTWDIILHYWTVTIFVPLILLVITALAMITRAVDD